MNSDSDILEFLLDVKGAKPLDVVYLYESCCGELFYTISEKIYNIQDYKTCKNNSQVVNIGFYIDLIKHYSKALIKQTKTINGIGISIYDTLDLDSIIINATKNDEHKKGQTCEDIKSCYMGEDSILTILKNDKIPYICKKCILDKELIEIFY